MARALSIPGAMDATMIVDLGEKSTDLVIVYRNQPRLVRTIPGGFSNFVKTLAGGLDVREDQARQFILKFGLAEDKVEGQVFKTLSHILEGYASELTKSVRFFQTKYLNGKVGGIVRSGRHRRRPQQPQPVVVAQRPHADAGGRAHLADGHHIPRLHDNSINPDAASGSIAILKFNKSINADEFCL